ncbi:hypothetical protein N7509_013457 [Penicillium cosmopolitanum]|uniref:Uncharacterized protein n=1 Tax=Penicillium cosmopolitanum TaxID=1131564 RepID=A0A9W9VEM9_9EURO|nr:uncharacterized protein N7509_013457 [Penicillium cosmopolitanum]KAJ5376571.1 hypothetical protein N7509_013457 [Penicillium cosmopolitanum]
MANLPGDANGVRTLPQDWLRISLTPIWGTSQPPPQPITTSNQNSASGGPNLAQYLFYSAEASMTHTTGLGVGSVMNRHSAPERSPNPRHTGRAHLTSISPTLTLQADDYWAIRLNVPVLVFHIFLAWTQACGVPCSPLMLEDAALAQGEVIGIVIGAIALFSIISILPIFLVWHRRRRQAAAAARPVNQALVLSSSMEQVSVERWLEQQNTNSDIEQYAEDTCAPFPVFTLGAWAFGVSAPLPFFDLAPPYVSAPYHPLPILPTPNPPNYLVANPPSVIHHRTPQTARAVELQLQGPVPDAIVEFSSSIGVIMRFI